MKRDAYIALSFAAAFLAALLGITSWLWFTRGDLGAAWYLMAVAATLAAIAGVLFGAAVDRRAGR